MTWKNYRNEWYDDSTIHISRSINIIIIIIIIIINMMHCCLKISLKIPHCAEFRYYTKKCSTWLSPKFDPS